MMSQSTLLLQDSINYDEQTVDLD
jgi:hypothetical protein